MAAKAEKKEPAKKATAGQAEVLPAAGAVGGLPLHSPQASQGPVNSEASSVAEAYADPDAAAEPKKKGMGAPKGAVKITTRGTRIYTKFGRTFRHDSYGSDQVDPSEFSDEQWSELRASPYLMITKAGAPETDL